MQMYGEAWYLLNPTYLRLQHEDEEHSHEEARYIEYTYTYIYINYTYSAYSYYNYYEFLLWTTINVWLCINFNMFFCLSLGIDKEIKPEYMQMKNGIYYFSKGGTTKLPKKCWILKRFAISFRFLSRYFASTQDKMLGAFEFAQPTDTLCNIYTRMYICVHVCVGTSI